ncbi:hypothetical protein NIES4074_19390 [Cylindrospermum sp. NIES-4074]|nr:hypothetical protein NIES4074_19390 [Cylindrospermum sp. NIES-4074]
MAANLRLLLETNVRVTSFVIVCLVSAYVLMPTISETTKALKTLITNNFGIAEGDGAYVAKTCWIQQAFTAPKARCNHPLRMVGQQHPHSDRHSTAKSNIYIPPNYGGPDSQHGSGTR